MVSSGEHITKLTLDKVMTGVLVSKRFAEWQFAKLQFAQCQFAELHFAERQFAN